MPKLDEQFAHPSGVLGHVAGWIMARSSAGLSAWAHDLLALEPDDDVLEIGFGPGVALALAAERAYRGKVTGVDLSAEMVRQARRRNARAILEGRVDVRQGSVGRLPFADSCFDAGFAVNSSPFWPVDEPCYAELRRVLRPAGRAVIVVHPTWMRTDAQVGALAAATAEHLRAHGLRGVRMERLPMRPVSAFAAVGARPLEITIEMADAKSSQAERRRASPRVVRLS